MPYNIQKSATPDLIKSNKLDTSIDVKFPNNLVVPPIFTEVICDKLYNSFIQDLYMPCRMNLAADPINILSLQLVDLGLSTIYSLDKGASI